MDMAEETVQNQEDTPFVEGAVQIGLALLTFAIVGGMLFGGWTWYESSRGGVGLAWLGCMVIVIVSLLLVCLGLYWFAGGLGAVIRGVSQKKNGRAVLGAFLALAGILIPIALLGVLDLKDLRAKQLIAFFGIPFGAIAIGLVMVVTNGDAPQGEE